MASPRWKTRPPGSNWGDYGEDDQLGRLNLLNPDRVRRAAAEIREGLTFCLSLPLDVPRQSVLNPRRQPPVLRPTLRGTAPNFNCCPDPAATDVICDDLVVLHTQYSTQWDGLSHIGQMFDADGDGKPEPVYYNGFRAGSDVKGPTSADAAGMPNAQDSSSSSFARRLGIEHMAEQGAQGRGVMIDLRRHFGDAHRFIGFEDLQAVLKVDGIRVEEGDMVCIHTGFAERLMESVPGDSFDPHAACCVLDGSDPALLQWITDCGLSVLTADNYAVEGQPPRRHVEGTASAPLHEHCLFKLGIHLGELWWLTPLADWLHLNRRHRFLLTAPPLRLTGAVGSPVTPIATV